MIGDLVVHIHNFLKSVKLQETRKVLLQFANYKLVLSLEYKEPFFFFFCILVLQIQDLALESGFGERLESHHHFDCM